MNQFFRTIVVVLLLLSGGEWYVRGSDLAAEFDAANRLYVQGKFSQAAVGYETMLEAGNISPALLYNFGNANFKSGRIGRAIAAYRQAERLTPRDPDVRANLQFARNQVQGPTNRPARWRQWLQTLTVNEWTGLAAAGFWGCFALLGLGQLQPAWRRRLRFYALLVVGGTLPVLACLALAIKADSSRRDAVVIQREAVVRAGPLDEAQSAFVVHDGAELTVLDRKDDWLRVSDGGRRAGWIKRDAVVELGTDQPSKT